MTYTLYQPKLDPRLYNPAVNSPWQGEYWKAQGILDPNDPYNERNMEKYTNELTRHMQYRPPAVYDEFGVKQEDQYQMVNGQAVESIGGDYYGQGSPGRRGYFLDRGTLNEGQMYDPYGAIVNSAGRYRKLPINEGLGDQRGHQQWGGENPARARAQAYRLDNRLTTPERARAQAYRSGGSALNPTGNSLTSALMR